MGRRREFFWKHTGHEPHVDAVVLYGDPRFDAGALDCIQGAAVSSGILAEFHPVEAHNIPYLPPALRGKAQSFRIERDVVCNAFDAAGAMNHLGPHLGYAASPYVQQAVDFVLGRLEG